MFIMDWINLVSMQSKIYEWMLLQNHEFILLEYMMFYTYIYIILFTTADTIFQMCSFIITNYQFYDCRYDLYMFFFIEVFYQIKSILFAQQLPLYRQNHIHLHALKTYYIANMFYMNVCM